MKKHFLKTGSCYKCGSAIWTPDDWTLNTPPPSYFSCKCFDVAVVPPNTHKELLEKISFLEGRIAKLESEIKSKDQQSESKFLKD